MKATELMLGDWVKYMDITPSEVVAIDGTATCRIRTLISNKIDEFGNKDYKAITTRIEDIEPIPLTAEILEKNGFRIGHHGMYHIWGFYIGNHYDSYFTPYVDVGCATRDLTYVHELQQALRLGGRKDLADNFKI